ncbi:hypothetical protein LUZ60_004523 [Juncus effusus]|nr:hypothetical protein LUZ60_004523 [Juncus effusus]
MAMALSFPSPPVSSHPRLPPSISLRLRPFPSSKPLPILSSSKPFPSPKLVRYPALDNHASRHSHLRFARKLSTLLLSKPKQFLPLKVLYRCKKFLTVPRKRPLLPMILRYPSLFRLFYSPCNNPSSPMASVLSVSLTPNALSLFQQSSVLRAQIADSLACKLQRLLMMSPHRRILLSKLVHLGPDLGLPMNFRTKLCNVYPERFITINTSYGRALQLVSFDSSLASPVPPLKCYDDNRILDRPRRFEHLPLRRGLNLRRHHRDFLLGLQNLPEISPYEDCDLASLSAEMAEKRACAVVREILGMSLEKRTLIDHLTHFRKDFHLPNRLRALLVRHPEMFYVSIKGIRHSVFLVEAYNDDGKLIVQDELLKEKQRLMELVSEGKRMRRQRRKGLDLELGIEEEQSKEEFLDSEDGFEGLFESGIGEDWEEMNGEEEEEEEGDEDEEEERIEEFWVKKAVEAGVIEGAELDVW